MTAGEYEEARESMSVAHTWMKRLGESLNRYDNDQAGALNVWRRWVQETLDDSRATGGYAVVVDKSAHKAYLVKAGTPIRTYNCDLGYNSARQKMFAGDGATPEGKYVVSVSKPRGSRYYKALLINYPNEADRKRFSDNKSKGVISQRARVGNLIEIHGNGGRNRDWTEGCVALTDRDMDNIMQFVGVGTPITIVRRSDRWP
jgi:murein L,D-transpeptidase YafK